VASLAARSFALHAALAEDFGAEAIGYRQCQAVQPTCEGGATDKAGDTWYDGCGGGGGSGVPVIAPRDTAAQVVPAYLTEALFAASGAELVIGAPTGLARRSEGGGDGGGDGGGGEAGGGGEGADSGAAAAMEPSMEAATEAPMIVVVDVEASKVGDDDVERRGATVLHGAAATGGACRESATQAFACDALLLACGPWTSGVAATLRVAMDSQVLGQKAASVLLEPTMRNGSATKGKEDIDDSCLFLDWRGDPSVGDFEVYPRLDGVYVCGGSEPPCVVREHPREVGCTDETERLLVDSAASVSSALAGAKVLRATACYLPVADTGEIVAGRLEEEGVFVACGHGCWGILNGPATGKGMAEMMWECVVGGGGKGGRGGGGGGGKGGRREGGRGAGVSDASLLEPFAPRLRG
jgi:hypothetical protein